MCGVVALLLLCKANAGHMQACVCGGGLKCSWVHARTLPGQKKPWVGPPAPARSPLKWTRTRTSPR